YCIPCIPLYILCTHVYPSNTVYPVYPYLSCVPMFTLLILYTFNTLYPVYPYISCVPMFTLVILYTLFNPYLSSAPINTVYLVYPCVSCLPMFTLMVPSDTVIEQSVRIPLVIKN
ncbi:unnamed protein product, partial [Porites lobata]